MLMIYRLLQRSLPNLAGGFAFSHIWNGNNRKPEMLLRRILQKIFNGICRKRAAVK